MYIYIHTIIYLLYVMTIVTRHEGARPPLRAGPRPPVYRGGKQKGVMGSGKGWLECTYPSLGLETRYVLHQRIDEGCLVLPLQFGLAFRLMLREGEILLGL